MPVMLSSLYHALLEAGASEERATQAAEEAAQYETRLVSIDTKLDRLATRVESLDAKARLLETLMNHTRVEMRTLCSIVIGIALGILWRVWH